MIPVYSILEKARQILGRKDDAYVFPRITEAVELLAQKGDFDATSGTLDIVVHSRVVTLPREVETVVAVNMLGHPATARDQWYRFHENGPGDCGMTLPWEWDDLGGNACVFREIACPAKLVAYCTEDADVGAELWVYGLDHNGNTIRTQQADGSWADGYQVPVLKAYQALEDKAPFFSRITRVRKVQTAGPVRLSTIENAGDGSGTLLGIYQWDELEPRYRRIKLSQKVNWVRIAYRRRSFEVTSKWDLLPLNSRPAILMMLRAGVKYEEPGGIPEAEAMEATATRWATEKAMSESAPVVAPIQVHDPYGGLVDIFDYVD